MKLTITLALACLLGAAPAAHAEQPMLRARSAGAFNGANVDAAGARCVFADGQGNVNANANSAITTANGSSGASSKRFTRNADGSASGERSSTATNANTGVTWNGSTTYTKGEGVSRSGGCTDAAGNTVACGAAR
jgi:hypothetical protein